MNSRYKIALSMLVSAALGAAAVQGLHAQAKPKAYLITESQVLDREALNTYFPKIVEAAKRQGGRVAYIGPSEKTVPVVGEAPKRIGVSEW